MAARFDQGTLALAGPATALQESVGVGQYGRVDLAMSGSGTLLYASSGAESDSSALVWVYRDGTVEPLAPAWQGIFRTVALSPDGSRVAVSVVEGGQEHVWVRAVTSGPPLRLTFSGNLNWRPEWTPDGQAVTFVSDRGRNLDLYVKRADGTGAARPLLDRDRGVEEAKWSPDGHWLVFREGGGLSGGQRDIYAIHEGVDTAAS